MQIDHVLTFYDLKMLGGKFLSNVQSRNYFGVFSHQRPYSISNAKLTERKKLEKVHKQQGWPQAWEYGQAKQIQTLGRSSQGVDWSLFQKYELFYSYLNIPMKCSLHNTPVCDCI